MPVTLIFPVIVAWGLAIALLFMHPERIRLIVLAALGAFLSGFLTLAYLAADYFTGNGITAAVIFHLLQGTEGAGLLEYPALLFALVTGGIALLLLTSQLIRRKHRRSPNIHFTARKEHISHVVTNSAAYGFLAFSIAAHPALSETLTILMQHQADAYLSRDVALIDNHLRPIQIQHRPARGKNLVFLYAESLERTYFDQQRFPNLIKELRTLETEAISFTAIGQAALTDWTIAGMAASQCGIPLSPFLGVRNNANDPSRPVPGATCIGDILSKHGYHLAYMGGADIKFAGKEKFYRQQNFQEVLGLSELQGLLAENAPLSGWGLYDDALLDLAFIKFVSLADEEQPFGLFLLTLDTHSPRGHVTPSCADLYYGNGKSTMLNSVACADTLIARFIRRIRASPYARDTVIIVASDHLAIRNDVSATLDSGGNSDRTNLFLVFGSDIHPAKISKPGTTLDIAPTVLPLLGFEIEAVALGRNLLGNQPTLVEILTSDTFNTSLSAWRLK